MTLTIVDDAHLTSLLRGWLPEQRWYAGKGVAADDMRVEVVSRTMLVETGSLVLEHVLVHVEAGPHSSLYQVPLSHLADVPSKLAPWTLGHHLSGSAVPCDALRDPRAATEFARLLGDEARIGALEFRGGAAALDPGDKARVLSVEQSNTSVVYGDSVLVKWFRQVPHGINPDVELHRALSEQGCPAVAELRGTIDLVSGGETVTLAMVQEFLSGSADGWSMATASVRDLLAEADLLAEEVGTDFADESHRLGQAVARVHADLASALGTSTAPGSQVADALRTRIHSALEVAPALAELAERLHTRADEVAALGEVSVQRVHGDLHLGQVLRATDRWVLLDFEGEPSAALDERRRPDSPLRDVAGMLRSMDYASAHALIGENPDRQRLFRTREWSTRNVDAFCEGYAEESGSDPREQLVLLRAYLLDKALYEVGYEVRNRPGWVSVPRAAVDRLLDD